MWRQHGLSSHMRANLSLAAFTFLLILVISFAEKLNERRILLPYNSGLPTNFTLEALSSSSCYKWSSSRPDIASVKHLDDASCSRRAVVTVVSQTPKRQSSVVTAHDLKTNLQMRCDVEIDVISRVLITTTTRQIVLGELPEMIKAVAFDEKNDIFTSIGGIHFDWTIAPLDIIRYRTWASGSYAAPDFVEFWESKGAKSSYVLMEGVRTGVAKVKARILGEAYQSVEPSEITVHVVANLKLIPSNDLFLVRGAKVAFRAEISKQGPRVPLELPSAQYYLDVSEPAIAVFDEEKSLLEATSEGHTSLVLRDRNVDGEGLSQTSTDIHVMRPSYLSLSISPGETPALRSDTLYVLTLSLHDDWHHKLYPSENLALTLDLPEAHFSILEASPNGTYYVVRTKDEGTVKLKGAFLGAGSILLETPLELTQEVTIYAPITLHPPQILLPWIADSQPAYTVFIQAAGATGEFNWETGDEGLAQVKYATDVSSRATVTTKGEGQAVISVNDVHNSLMFNSAMRIDIRPIEALEVLPSIVETHIGGSVILPVAVLGYRDGKPGKKEYFDDCAQVPFTVQIVEKNRIRYDAEVLMAGMGEHSCRSLSFSCLASGNSRIWISYGGHINTSAIVGCYAPLRLVHPAEMAVLSLGAVIDLAFEGGPRPWSLFPEGHLTQATASNVSVVVLTEIKDRYRYNKDLHVYRTRCVGYGETVVEVTVGNAVSPTLAKPASTHASVRLRCAPPETLILRPKMKASCPQQDLLFAIEANTDLQVDVTVLDVQGQAFYNFSTLYFDWSTDGDGTFAEMHAINEEVNGAKGYFALTRSYQQLTRLSSRRCKVRARISGYHGAFIGERFDVLREIELVLAQPHITQEQSITIVKHASYKKVISIEHGSGYFAVEDTSVSGSIALDFKPTDKTFTVSPRSLGSGVLSIVDLCLNFAPLSVAYSVVEAVSVQVHLIDKIQQDATVAGFFAVIDNRGQRLHSSLHGILQFAVIPSNGVLSVGALAPKDDWTSGFTVKADRLGICKLAVQSQSPQVKTVESAPVEVHVFSPLKLIPSTLTLIVGNSFQAKCLGGPQTQRNVHFSMEDDTLATVAANGLVTARHLGTTRLTGKVTNADNFEYSRAIVDVRVVALRKIKIWSPISQIGLGSHLPLHLLGGEPNSETPFAFAQADPPLKITWTLSNDKIASLESSFAKYGIVDSVSDQIAARLEAKAIGTVTVKVRVEVTQPARTANTEQIAGNVVLTDSIQLNVYAPYAPLFLPPGASFAAAENEAVSKWASQVLLLSPNAQLHLHFSALDRIRTEVSSSGPGCQVRLTNKTELVLQTGDTLEVTSLTVHRDVHQSGLLETYLYAVHVDKVRYLALEFADTPTQKPLAPIDVLPLGSQVRLSVAFFDNHGRRFDSVKSRLHWQLSRDDVLTVLAADSADTGTVTVRALKEGSVVVHIVDEVSHAAAYYKLNVGHIIEPNDNPLTLQVGDVLCLRSRTLHPVDSPDASDHHALWSLESPRTAYLSAQQGALVALQPGNTVAVYNSSRSSLHATYVKVHVEAAPAVTLDVSQLAGLSTTGPVAIPLTIGRHQGTMQRESSCGKSTHLDAILINLRTSGQMPVHCSATFADAGGHFFPWHVTAHYSTEHGGHWLCALTPRGTAEERAGLEMHNLEVTLQATVGLAADPTPVRAEARLAYLPAFVTTTRHIVLTTEAPEFRFTVASRESVLAELRVSPSNGDIVEVRKDGPPSDNMVKVQVRLRNADIFSNDVSNLHLLLVSGLTNQTEKIPVQIKLYGSLAHLPAKLFVQPDAASLLYTALFALGTLALAAALYLASKALLRALDQHGDSKGTVGSGADASFANGSSPNKSIRVIDYHNSSFASPSAVRFASPSLSRASPLSGDPGTSRDTSPASPRSPQVGRPLYTTRSFQQ